MKTINAGMFDFDGNIIHTIVDYPVYKKNEAGVRLKHTATGEAELREVFSNPHTFQTLDDNASFVNCSDHWPQGEHAFKNSYIKGLADHGPGPSFDAFMEMLIAAAPISINTARRHGSHTVREFFSYAILEILSAHERAQFVKNYAKNHAKMQLKSHGQESLQHLSEAEVAAHYASEQKVYTLNHPDTIAELGVHEKDHNHVKKAHGLRNRIRMLTRTYQGYLITIGFSDDDSNHIHAIQDRVLANRDLIQSRNPEGFMHFVTYYTENPYDIKIDRLTQKPWTDHIPLTQAVHYNTSRPQF